MHQIITKYDGFSLEDMQQLQEIEQYYYPKEIISDPILVFNWWKKNPYTLQALYNQQHQMIGSLTTLPISDFLFGEFCLWTYQDTELPVDEILIYEDDGIYNLYICAISLHPNYKGKKGYLKRLCMLWIEQLIMLYKERNIQIKTLFGDVVTDDGERFADFLWMRALTETQHNSTIFIRHFEEYWKELQQLKVLFQ